MVRVSEGQDGQPRPLEEGFRGHAGGLEEADEGQGLVEAHERDRGGHGLH